MTTPAAQPDRRNKLIAEFDQQYGGAPELFARAPGRVDLIGSHTDYNQGFVVTQAIDRDTWIAARPRPDRRVCISSLNINSTATFSLDHLEFDPNKSWTNYLRGVAEVLQAEGYALSGFDGLIDSTIPLGSGLSSSAALEVATAMLFQALADWRIEPVQIARLCQQAENDFVGVNSGILDQYSSVMGQQDRMLLLDARSLESQLIPVDEAVSVVICDTKAERVLAESEYEQRRAQCEQAVAFLRRYHPELAALRDVNLSMLAKYKSELRPTVYQRARFIVEENQRVLDFAEAIAAGNYERAGELMHESFIGADELYEIVSPEMRAMQGAIRQAPGSYGGRGAGAGFGGVLVALVEAQSVDDFIASVEQDYRDKTGIDTEVFPVRATYGAGLVF